MRVLRESISTDERQPNSFVGFSAVFKNTYFTPQFFNIALNLKRVQGQYKDEDIITDFDRVQLSLHINTNAENTEYRFKDDAIIDFLKSVSI